MKLNDRMSATVASRWVSDLVEWPLGTKRRREFLVLVVVMSAIASRQGLL
jgi:hypothetical protein